MDRGEQFGRYRKLIAITWLTCCGFRAWRGDSARDVLSCRA
jgi:hypothetical protein